MRLHFAVCFTAEPGSRLTQKSARRASSSQSVTCLKQRDTPATCRAYRWL